MNSILRAVKLTLIAIAFGALWNSLVAAHSSPSRVPLSQAVNPEICAAPPNPVVAENCLPGTDEWITQNPIGDIFGYSSADSVNHGETLEMFVTTGSQVFDIRIYRLGYYQGFGGRLVQEIERVPGRVQPDCYNNYVIGLTTCSNWLLSYSLQIPEKWISGVYVARLIRPDTGGDNYILFVVREDERNSAILYQQSVSTFHAYNNYGGKSTYSSRSGFCPTVAQAPRAVAVSYNRPYNQTMTDPNGFFRAEFPMLRWLEANGYDVTYSTTSDTHRSGRAGAKNELLDHRVFLSVGHDEYWSQEMRAAIEAARDAGVHLGFFTANTGYWRVRMEPDPLTGEPDSVLVTYKTIESGPEDPSGHSTSTWRDPHGPNRPENELIGVMYIGDNDSLFFPMRVTAEQASHPVFRNTGLDLMPPKTYVTFGDQTVGWEWDAVVSNGLIPANLEILAESPVVGMLLQDAGKFENGDLGIASAQAILYTAPSGAIVFASGTIQWSWGLGAQGLEIAETDPIISQVTYNVLSDMGVEPTTPDTALVTKGQTNRSTSISPSRFIPIDAPAPLISNLRVQVDGDNATFVWDTNVETISQVWLGGRSGHVIFPEAQDLTYRTNHQLRLENLSIPVNFKIGPAVFDGPERYFRVVSIDRNGRISLSEEGVFILIPPISTTIRNSLNDAFLPIRCFARANQSLAVALAVVGGAAVLAAVVMGIVVVIRRRRQPGLRQSAG